MKMQMLRVYFGDNDYASWVKDACTRFLWEVSGGFGSYESVKRYQDLRETKSLEDVRMALVMATYGFYLSDNAVSFRQDCKNGYNLEKYEFNLDYIDKSLKVEEVELFNECDDNHEACYIDFYNADVYLK